jgi:hypothetical protein
MKITNRRIHTDWTDIAFTALPQGWVNVFKYDGEHYTEPCPGVLTQEAVTATHIWTEEHEDGRTDFRQQKHDIDRATRTVFADHDGGELMEVDMRGDYVTTTTAEEWAERQTAEQAEKPA